MKKYIYKFLFVFLILVIVQFQCKVILGYVYEFNAPLSYEKALNGDDNSLIDLLDSMKSSDETIPAYLINLLIHDFTRVISAVDIVSERNSDVSKNMILDYIKFGFKDYFLDFDKKELMEFYFFGKTQLRTNSDFNYVFNSETLGYVTESSTLDKKVYKAFNVYDGDKNTAWVEGVKGSGINEWIVIYLQSFESERNVISKIKITNGYAKSKELYEANNRVKTVQIELSDGQKRIVELKDTMEPQIVIFDRSIIQSVKLTILDVYKGSKYDDTCISEVEFLY